MSYHHISYQQDGTATYCLIRNSQRPREVSKPQQNMDVISGTRLHGVFYLVKPTTCLIISMIFFIFSQYKAHETWASYLEMAQNLPFWIQLSPSIVLLENSCKDCYSTTSCSRHFIPFILTMMEFSHPDSVLVVPDIPSPSFSWITLTHHLQMSLRFLIYIMGTKYLPPRGHENSKNVQTGGPQTLQN